jgi:N-acetylneuraminate synthase
MSYFIAEVSSNHSKDLDRAIEFVDIAAEIGCDAVKFQLFKIDKLFSPEILNKSASHRNRVNWELPLDFLPHLAERCNKLGIDFGCTPFYIEAVNELEPYVDFYKIASYELLWDDLHAACAKTGKPIIISTGMATMDEISHAVNILKTNGCTNPSVLHCSSAYPTPYKEANLAAIETIRNATNCNVGWSDHTVNQGVIQRAVNRWDASVIEFHLDIEGQGEEFNSGHCWLPCQIKNVIAAVKCGSNADGDGIKTPNASEMPDRDWRTDPADGLRPFKHIRKIFKG